MNAIRKFNIRLFTTFVAIAAVTCYSTRLVAQDVDAIYLRYKDDQAVITNIKEQLTIKNEHGTLVANSSTSKETMLIGSMSPGLYNTEYIFHSYFNKLEDYNASALIFEKDGYKKQSGFSAKTVHSEQNNIFYDDVKQTEISFNGLTPRSLLRMQYTISHTDIHMLPAFYFQKSMPVAQSTYEVTAPKYVDLKFVIKGNGKESIKQTRQENKNTVTYTFTATDVPVLKEYEDVPSAAWHELHIVPYISSYKLPGEETTEMLNEPARLYDYYYKFIRDLNVRDDDTLDQLVSTITAGDTTQKEKADHIYQWVQQNIYYIAFEDSLQGFIPRQAASICRRKFGDCKDMASIITAMCRKAGITAYFTWIGTRLKPYTYEETPLPIVDNHMICTVKIGDEWIFMDGTHPLIPFGQIPEYIQDKEAMVAIDEKNFKIIPVPETAPERNVTIDSTHLQINGARASGEATVDYQGYPSWALQSVMMYNKNEDRDQLVRQMNARGSNKYVQKSYRYMPSDTGYKNCRITSDFTIDDYVGKVDNEYIVNMNVNRYCRGDNIDTEGRDVPVYFKYKDIRREVVVLDIPQGYHVSYLPPEASGNLKDTWEYSIKYSQQGNKVILSKEFITRSMSVLPVNFTQHNAMIDNLKKQYKESVVLIAD